MKIRSLFFLCFLLSAQAFSQEIRHNSWSLIIYRPQNSSAINEIRCNIKLEDAETGEDVTYSKAKAWYEWVSDTKLIQIKNPESYAALFQPKSTTVLYNYRKSRYLSGGMAMHLNLKPGKYKISVYTKKDMIFGIENPGDQDWNSNEFYYDTSNPAKVLFVSPVANDNGFYKGGWHIDYKAPAYYKFTKPLMN